MQLLLTLSCLLGTILSTSSHESVHQRHEKPKVAINGYVNGYYKFLGRQLPEFLVNAHTAFSGIETANEQAEIHSAYPHPDSHSEAISKSSLLLNHQHAGIQQERLNPNSNPFNSAVGSTGSDLEVLGHGSIHLAPVTENDVEKATHLNNNYAGRVMDTEHIDSLKNIGSINSHQTNVYSESRTPILGVAGRHDYRGEEFAENNKRTFGTLTGMKQVNNIGSLTNNKAGETYLNLGWDGNVYAGNQNSFTRGATYGDFLKLNHAYYGGGPMAHEGRITVVPNPKYDSTNYINSDLNGNQIFTQNQKIGQTSYKDSASMSSATQASGGAVTQNRVVHTFVDHPVHYTSQLGYTDNRLYGSLGLKDPPHTNYGEPTRYGQTNSAWSLEGYNQMNLNPSVENIKQLSSDGKSINHQTSKVVEKENVITFSNAGGQNPFQSIANSKVPTITEKGPFGISRWMDHVQNKGIINQNLNSKFGVTDQADNPNYFLNGNTGILDHKLYTDYGHGSLLDMNQINNIKGSIIQKKTEETFVAHPNYYSQMDYTNTDVHNPNVYVDEAYHRTPKVTDLEGSYPNTGSVKNGAMQNKNMFFGQTDYNTDQINQRGTANSKLYQETIVTNPDSFGVTKQNNFNGNLYFNGNGLDVHTQTGQLNPEGAYSPNRANVLNHHHLRNPLFDFSGQLEAGQENSGLSSGVKENIREVFTEEKPQKSMGVQTNYEESGILDTVPVYETMGGLNLNQEKTNWNLNIGGAGSIIPSGESNSNYVGIGQRLDSLGLNSGIVGQNQNVDQTSYEAFPGTSQVNTKVGTSIQKKVSQTVISYPNYGRIDEVGTGLGVNGLQVNQNQNQAVFPSYNANGQFLVNTGYYPLFAANGRIFLQGGSYGRYPIHGQFPLWGTLNYPFEMRPPGKYYPNNQYLLQGGVDGQYPLQSDPLQSGLNIQYSSQIGLNSQYYPQSNINVRYPSQVGFNGRYDLSSPYSAQGPNVHYSVLSGHLNPMLGKQLSQGNQDSTSVSSRIKQNGSDHDSSDENVGQEVGATDKETIDTEKQMIHATSESGNAHDEAKPILVENTVKIVDASTSINGEAEPIPMENTVKRVNTTTSINESEKYISQNTVDETPESKNDSLKFQTKETTQVIGDSKTITFTIRLPSKTITTKTITNLEKRTGDDHMIDEHHTLITQQPGEKKGIQITIDSPGLASNQEGGESHVIDLSPRLGVIDQSEPVFLGLVNKTEPDGHDKDDSAMKLNKSDNYQMSLVGSVDNEEKPNSHNKELVEIGVTKGTDK